MKGTDITSEGASSLEDAYASSEDLAFFFVGSTQFTRKERSAFSLKQFPNAWLNMTFLRVINLAGNQITELPWKIGELVNLRELNLRNNRLQALPYSMAALQNLRVLNLDGNDMLTPPKEIVKVKNQIL
jgi:Leucine-rich repeat (LRR) protein